MSDFVCNKVLRQRVSGRHSDCVYLDVDLFICWVPCTRAIILLLSLIVFCPFDFIDKSLGEMMIWKTHHNENYLTSIKTSLHLFVFLIEQMLYTCLNHNWFDYMIKHKQNRQLFKIVISFSVILVCFLKFRKKLIHLKQIKWHIK